MTALNPQHMITEAMAWLWHNSGSRLSGDQPIDTHLLSNSSVSCKLRATLRMLRKGETAYSRETQMPANAGISGHLSGGH